MKKCSWHIFVCVINFIYIIYSLELTWFFLSPCVLCFVSLVVHNVFLSSVCLYLRFLRWRLSSWQKSCFLPSTPQQASLGPWSIWRGMLHTHLPFHAVVLCFFFFFSLFASLSHAAYPPLIVLMGLPHNGRMLDIVRLWKSLWLSSSLTRLST